MTGHVPVALKKAVVTPIHKKPSLPLDNLKNYRPVSNLPFVSKIIEKVVASQLNDHLSKHDIKEKFQSAYRRLHSTETAIIKLQNDILRCLGNRKCVLLVLLDLSSAFDTIDHDILISCLRDRFGVQGTALSWFRSYLSDRLQCVCVKHCFSKGRCLKCGVPQGSVLGPLLFILYLFGLGDILRGYDIDYHFYADDNQLYLSFEPNQEGDLERAISILQKCAADIRKWMTQKFLKLNEDKTEFVIFSSYRCHTTFEATTVTVGDDTVEASKCVRNLGAYFDNHLTMESHVNQIIKSANYHLRRIRYIRPYLTTSATERVIHAFVTSKLDMNNGLLHGLPDYLIKALQRVQNSAACLVTPVQMRQHMKPVLKALHWLPVSARIEFKICLLVYKCLHGLAPDYLADCLTNKTKTMGLRSSNQVIELFIPPTKLNKFGDRAFSVCGPRLWNALPQTTRSAPNVDIFKQRLKTHLFNKN